MSLRHTRRSKRAKHALASHSPVQNKCNVGYAFINFIDPQSIVPFYQQYHGKKWEKFNSEKVCDIAYARIQGKVRSDARGAHEEWYLLCASRH